MFDIGDEVVCIDTPKEADYQKAIDAFGDIPYRLQIGVVYTIVDVHSFPRAIRHSIGLCLAETGTWYWSYLLFRKVKKIEEPRFKKVVERVPELV